jgi:hypothetical protein
MRAPFFAMPNGSCIEPLQLTMAKQLVEFENHLLFLMQWGWNDFTRNRSARLITETSNSRDENV